jgi:hypothetical protein
MAGRSIRSGPDSAEGGSLMGGFLRRLLKRGRANGPRRPRRSRVRPEVDALEGRQLLAVSMFSVNVVPKILKPADGRYIPVTVSGIVAAAPTDPALKTFFYVTDQYGTDEPRGKFELHPTPGLPGRSWYSYSFTVHLHAQIGSQSPNGRQYVFLVGVNDGATITSQNTVVLVPKTVNPHPKGPAAAHAARVQHTH